MSLLENLRKRGLKDVTNPKKWGMYLKSTLGLEYEEFSSPAYVEQMVWRMTQEGCRECVNGTKCIVCGCKTPNLFYDRRSECEGMHWGPMMEPEEWVKYKEEHDIIIDVDYMAQLLELGKIETWK